MDRKVFTQVDALSPNISKFYGMFEENRKRLFEMLEDVTDEMIDYTPKDGTFETIGTLLYHIAAIEWDWIFYDIDKINMDWDTWKYAFANRYEEVEQLQGKGKQFYIDALDKVRQDIYERFKKFNDSDLDRIIDSDGREFALNWIFFHLINHEALHIGQISMLKRLYKS